MSRVFISYSHADQAWAAKVADSLSNVSDVVAHRMLPGQQPMFAVLASTVDRPVYAK